MFIFERPSNHQPPRQCVKLHIFASLAGGRYTQPSALKYLHTFF
jgi:hypothetical protein